MKMNSMKMTMPAIARWRPHHTSRWRKLLTETVLLTVLTCAALAPLSLLAGGGPPRSRGDRILVKPKPDIPPGQLRSFEARLGCKALRQFPHLANWQVVQIP